MEAFVSEARKANTRVRLSRRADAYAMTLHAYIIASSIQIVVIVEPDE